MYSLKKSIIGIINFIGINPISIIINIVKINVILFAYIKMIIFYKIKRNDRIFKIGRLKPVHFEKYAHGLDKHYFYQDLIVSKKIFKNNPNKHLDIGSRIDGFISTLTVFRKIDYIDILPLDIDIDNLKFMKMDITDSGFDIADYYDSISCLHVIDHIGLPRYSNQKLDFYGPQKALKNIYKALKKGGVLYLSVPIGKNVIEFNANYVFSIKYLLDILDNKYDIKEFNYIDDKDRIHRDIDVNLGIDNNFNCRYGCGIFELIKK